MKTYFALLRGINVSGKNIIKMELLRTAMAELGYGNISTYIQSGNIIFTSNEIDALKLEKSITAKILEHFSLEITVIVITPEDLQNSLTDNPYKDIPTDSVQPYISFFSETPSAKNIAALKAVDFGNDVFTIKDRTCWIVYADSAANTKLNNAVMERKLKVRATARNRKTVQKLIEMAKAII